ASRGRQDGRLRGSSGKNMARSSSVPPSLVDGADTVVMAGSSYSVAVRGGLAVGRVGGSPRDGELRVRPGDLACAWGRRGRGIDAVCGDGGLGRPLLVPVVQQVGESAGELVGVGTVGGD